MPIEGVLLGGDVYRAPGYWISTEGLTLYQETGVGCGRKLEVVESVEVRPGMQPLDVVMIAGSALVVGAAGGIVLGITLD